MKLFQSTDESAIKYNKTNENCSPKNIHTKSQQLTMIQIIAPVQINYGHINLCFNFDCQAFSAEFCHKQIFVNVMELVCYRRVKFLLRFCS